MDAGFGLTLRSGTPAQFDLSLPWRSAVDSSSRWRSPPHAGGAAELRKGWGLTVGPSDDRGRLAAQGGGAGWSVADSTYMHGTVRPQGSAAFSGTRPDSFKREGLAVSKRAASAGGSGSTPELERPRSASQSLRTHFDQHFDQPLVRCQLPPQQAASSSRPTTSHGMEYRCRRRGLRARGTQSPKHVTASHNSFREAVASPAPQTAEISAHPQPCNYTVEIFRPPLAETLVDELIDLWAMPEVGFGGGCDDGENSLRAVLAGYEPENQQTVYVARAAGLDGKQRLAGTAVLLVSRDLQPCGSLGEVATHPDFRRRGIAEGLCTRARDDFRTVGGGILVLGTGNPIAARRYRKIGFLRVPGSNVYNLNADSTDDRSIEEFQVDHFRKPRDSANGGWSTVRIRSGTAAERLRMMALLHAPHDCPILDINLQLYSIRVAVQNSVNGLYPRYAALVDPRYANGVEKKGSPHDRGLRGCWWAMYSSENCDDEIDDEDEEGTLVGLASAAYQASQITNGGEAAGSDH